jgi:signal transduction histidine kinase
LQEVRRQADELQASRGRIVAAGDTARRTIERNLHDGAQQQIVALTIKLRLLSQMVERDAQRAMSMVADLQADANDALEQLRDLARGIYPPLLADQGLAAALQAQATKASVPTTVTSDGIDRYPQDTEAAVYFCVLEALTNIAKYAEATNAEVTVSQMDGELRFEVTDDGSGFDTRETSYGTGLQGMADRLDAIGGTLRVRSAPGRGTTVEGRISVTGAARPADLSSP